MSDQSYPDLTPQELDALSEKLLEDFVKDETMTALSIKSYPAGIHVTSIVPPEHGWPIAFHCSICKETIFLLSTWANKPEKGDYYKMNDVCASDEQSYAHNLKMAMKLPPAYMKY